MIVTSIISGIVALASSAISGWSDNQAVKAENKKQLQVKKQELKLAEIDAQIKSKEIDVRIKEKQIANDASYDMQVLRNRDKTFMDEVIIAIFLFLLIAPMIPYFHPYLDTAVSYWGKYPWWIAMIIVGIAVSTLGLMTFFKLWVNKFNPSKIMQSASDVDNVVDGVKQSTAKGTYSNTFKALQEKYNMVDTTARVDTPVFPKDDRRNDQ